MMLKKLLLSIFDSNIDKSLIKNINIIIADNDINKTAEKIVNELKEKLPVTFHLDYYYYPVKGLSNVRNELFKKALKLNPNYIVSIDDDEYPDKDWLNQLILTIVENNGDIAVGPVVPRFEGKVPSYISYWFGFHDYNNYQSIEFFHTGNFVISTDFLDNHKIEFDERFNTTGGEDTYFGISALKKGAKVYWAEKAIAYEFITKKRTNINWLIKRKYRGATNFVYVLKLEKQYLKLVKKFIISFVYLISGISAIILLLLPIKRRLWGILIIAEGLGGLAGFMNIRYKEY